MYTRIDELIWKDAKLKKISNESKLLFIYLLSCQHRNVLGLYSLPKYYVQGDLGYPLATVSKGLLELFNNGFITYDEESETVLVNNFLKYNPLENPNQVKGALKVMPTIPKTQLFYKLIDVIKSSENTHLHELKAGIESYLKSNGFERVTVTVSKQEEEEEEEEEKVKDKKAKPKGFSDLINEYTSDESLRISINDFIEMRKKNKKNMTERALELMLRKLDGLADNEVDKKLILNQSIENCWQGIFPLKDNLNQRQPKQQSTTNNPFLRMEMEGVFDNDE
jgi:hypothetical protein